MKSLRERQDSQYIEHSGVAGTVKIAKPRKKATFVSLVCSILAVFFMVSSISASFQGSSLLAYADDESDAKEEIQDEADDYIVDESEGDPFWATLDKMNKEDNPAAKNNFGSVMARLFSTQYMNDTSRGSSQIGKSNGINDSGLNCYVDAAGAGTPLYHNCDVPNIVTELIQDAASFLTSSGPKNAEVQKVKLAWDAFGLPDSIPDEGAPVDPTQRGVKYTALELYGYNMRLTSYSGEWDHIKVMTSARALANFGWMDNIKMSVTSIFEGVGTSLEVASDNFTDGISTGDVFGAIGGFFTGYFEGAAAGGIHSILDTSDLNVFNSYAWYRVGYGGTLYNARELTGTEIAGRARAQMLDMITSTRPEDAQVPADLAAISAGPDYPIEPISKCVLNRGELSDIEVGFSTEAPGITEENCRLTAINQYNDRQAGIDPSADPEEIPEDDDTYVWTRDGNRAEESLVEWKNRHADLFSTASQYGISCTVGDDEAMRHSDIAAFKACWPEAYANAVNEALKAVQTDNNIDWANEQVDPETLQAWVDEDPSRNFNAPWNRFVCTDSNGYDLRDGNGLVMLYDSNGNLNSNCEAVRPPIQNGLFGNGYLPNQEQPGIDTRNSITGSSLLSMLLPMDSIATGIGNFGLNIASFFTQVSNSVINLTFSPIFETLGLDGIIIMLIEQFRDSIFFPLVALMVAIAGIMALWSAGKNKDYKRQFISILLMAGTIITGVILMFRPEMTLTIVDEVPAQIERTVIGAIFSLGNDPDDKICESSATMPATPGIGLDGSTVLFEPNVSTRTLMCENWRAFAFNPWVFAQWGTDASKLYANGSGAENTLSNTNGALVGDAAVNMGAGHVVRNWALYQLDVMASGTASKADPSNPSGTIDRDFYRIIDVQAGPDSGAGTDGTYFENWSGQKWGDRIVVGLMSPIVAFIGAITVIIYSFTKIQIAFATVAMLMFLPFVFLLGIHPTMGRSKLKAYAGTIIGMMLQRIVLVLMMAVMFKVVIGFTTSSNNYLLNSIAAIMACIAFLIMRKDVLNMVFSTISAKMGAPVGGQFVTDPEAWQNSKLARPNGFIANKTAVAMKGAESIATGSIAGFVSGGFGGMSKAATQTFKIEKNKLLNAQRRRGFGALQSTVEAAEAGKKAAQRRIMETDEFKDAERVLMKRTDAYKKYEADLVEYENFDGEEMREDKTIFKKKDSGETMVKPTMPKLESGNKAKTTRNVQRFIQTQRVFDGMREEAAEEYFKNPESREDYEARVKAFKDYTESSDEGGVETLTEEAIAENFYKGKIEVDEQRERLNEIEELESENREYYQDIIRSGENKVQRKERMKENLRIMLEKMDEAVRQNQKTRKMKGSSLGAVNPPQQDPIDNTPSGPTTPTEQPEDRGE